jgi:ribosomal protein S18 acetylase RimI-like enzyme
MSQIEFRKAILSDELAELQEFDRRIFGEFPADLFDAEDWSLYESYWMIVDGQKVGCAALELNVDYDGTPRPGCLYIASTGILPEFQGGGLGRKQKEWQIEYARQAGFSTIVTNMRASNTPIIELNRSLGFQQREINPDYYEAPDEPAIVMELPVQQTRSSRGVNLIS